MNSVQWYDPLHNNRPSKPLLHIIVKTKAFNFRPRLDKKQSLYFFLLRKYSHVLLFFQDDTRKLFVTLLENNKTCSISLLTFYVFSLNVQNMNSPCCFQLIPSNASIVHKDLTLQVVFHYPYHLLHLQCTDQEENLINDHTRVLGGLQKLIRSVRILTLLPDPN